MNIPFATARLFIAVKIPEELAGALEKIIRRLAQTGAEVKWVKTKNLHLTLKFLGDVEESKIPDITSSLQNIKMEKFVVEIGSIGLLPNVRHPRVIYADVLKGAEKLEKLGFLVENEAVLLGFEPENRKFLAHLTLGRFKGTGHLNKLKEKIDCAKDESFGKLSVSGIYLIKSELRPDGPQYTELAVAPLQ